MYIDYTVTEEDEGKTAEEVLRQRLGFSSALCRRLRNEGGLTADGKFLLNKESVARGMHLEVRLLAENELEGPLEAKEEIAILFEDQWYAVVDKPPFTPTHPRFEGDRGLTTLLSDKRLHPANRLDTDTSGLVIIAKNGYAHDRLNRTEIKKYYKGLVHGITKEKGTMRYPISRMPDSIILRRSYPSGRPAVTHFVRTACWPKAAASLLTFRLETGRTHQIRVHCQAAGHPLAGDTLYGYEQTFHCRAEKRGRNRANYLLPETRSFKDPSFSSDFKALALNRLLRRQFLHAERLSFVHPISGETLDLSAPMPEDLLLVLRTLNRKETASGPFYSAGSLDD